MTRRWIKIPGPGEADGQGEWCQFVDYVAERSDGRGRIKEEDWRYIVRDNRLPTHIGETPPDGGA